MALAAFDHLIISAIATLSRILWNFADERARIYISIRTYFSRCLVTRHTPQQQQCEPTFSLVARQCNNVSGLYLPEYNNARGGARLQTTIADCRAHTPIAIYIYYTPSPILRERAATPRNTHSSALYVYVCAVESI